MSIKINILESDFNKDKIERTDGKIRKLWKVKDGFCLIFPVKLK